MVHEEVYKTQGRGNDFWTLVYRSSVPGGWIYTTTLTRRRMWGADDIYMTSVFVPDPTSPS
jgi:hypothetical protein